MTIRTRTASRVLRATFATKERSIFAIGQRKAAQQREGGVARPEVVERDRDPEVAQLPEQAGGLGEALDRRRLGQLEAHPVRGETRLGQRRHDEIHEARMRQLERD